jgi:hypothetical protein
MAAARGWSAPTRFEVSYFTYKRRLCHCQTTGLPFLFSPENIAEKFQAKSAIVQSEIHGDDGLQIAPR